MVDNISSLSKPRSSAGDPHPCTMIDEVTGAAAVLHQPVSRCTPAGPLSTIEPGTMKRLPSSRSPIALLQYKLILSTAQALLCVCSVALRCVRNHAPEGSPRVFRHRAARHVLAFTRRAFIASLAPTSTTCERSHQRLLSTWSSSHSVASHETYNCRELVLRDTRPPLENLKLSLEPPTL